MNKLERIKQRLKDATPGQWSVGGPYPSVSVIVCTDAGSTHPDHAEPPTYEPIAILSDAPIKGPHNEQAMADAEFIANAKTDIEWLVEQLELWKKAFINKDPELTMWSAKVRKCVLETKKAGEELLELIDRINHEK